MIVADFRIYNGQLDCSEIYNSYNTIEIWDIFKLCFILAVEANITIAEYKHLRNSFYNAITVKNDTPSQKQITKGNLKEKELIMANNHQCLALFCFLSYEYNEFNEHIILQQNNNELYSFDSYCLEGFMAYYIADKAQRDSGTNNSQIANDYLQKLKSSDLKSVLWKDKIRLWYSDLLTLYTHYDDYSRYHYCTINEYMEMHPELIPLKRKIPENINNYRLCDTIDFRHL